MTTYEIVSEIQKIQALRERVNEDTGEFIYSDENIEFMLKELLGDKEDKLNAIQHVRRKNKKEQEYYEDNKRRADAKIKRAKRLDESLKDLLVSLLDKKPVKTLEYTFSFRRTKGLNIINEAKLNKCFFVAQDPILDKKAVETRLKEGHIVKGAELVEKTSLAVR
jgi:vacuolar-type H+-ATPase subunit I/STV1